MRMVAFRLWRSNQSSRLTRTHSKVWSTAKVRNRISAKARGAPQGV